MALDLSAKTFDDESKPPNPALMSSSPDCDTSSSYDKRPTSSYSELHDKHAEPFPDVGYVSHGVKPVAGPVPSGHMMYAKSERLSPVSPLAAIQTSRPFKNYPIEAMSTMYSQMAASAASMSAGMYNGQFAGAASPGLFPGVGIVENIFSSPISQYLQQKMRRSDSRKGKNPSGMEQSPSSDHSPLVPDDAYLCNNQMPSLLSPESCGDNSTEMDDDMPTKRQRLSMDGLSVGNMSIEERRDESYWERRRKNNEAAKRSRDARRQKEEEIALRAAYLEQENLKLRAQVTILKNETAKLHYMLYNRM